MVMGLYYKKNYSEIFFVDLKKINKINTKLILVVAILSYNILFIATQGKFRVNSYQIQNLHKRLLFISIDFTIFKTLNGHTD